MKHKHCDLIKAWADGAVIQLLMPDYGIDGEIGESWKEIPHPRWGTSHKYRIKPQVKRFRVGVFKDFLVLTECDAVAVELENNHAFVKWLTDWQEVEV